MSSTDVSDTTPAPYPPAPITDVAGPRPPECFRVTATADLPAVFRDAERLAEKKQRDQQRLYALVEYIHAEDRQAFLQRYFGVAPAVAEVADRRGSTSRPNP